MKWETDQKMRPEESRQAAAARNSQHTATTKDGAKTKMNTYLMLLFRNRIHALMVEVSICLMVHKWWEDGPGSVLRCQMGALLLGR